MHATMQESHRSGNIRPQDVVSELKKHVLVDGFGLVIDLERSRGSRFVDAPSGRSLIDMYGFYATMAVGFNHPYFDRPEAREELTAAANLKTANSDVYSTAYAEFVDALWRVAGLPPLERFFFIEGGAPAVENALKAAMDWKVRRNIAAGRGERGTQILHFREAFHGRSGYTLSLTNTDPRKTDYFAKFDWPRVSNPRIDFSLPEAARSEKAAADERETERQILSAIEARPHEIAAVIVEPIQGEGGDNHFRAEFFRMLRRLCDAHEMLLIFDEVQSGMGITGKMWCCQHFGVTPDLLAFGKKARVCGVMAGPRLDEVKDNVFRLPSRINSTWGGNIVDMVRCKQLLHLYETEDLVGNADRMGRRMLAQLEAIAAEEPVIRAARGRGLMMAFDLLDTETRDRFWRGCFEIGLLTVRSGRRSVRLRPALDITADVIDETAGLIREQCRRLRT
ncbi:MAG: L-lysine 6-transaminase [Phycisphaerae bacterium]|nr:L-lysine 6-transaminase [Phycisphaerae bacterium]